PGRDLNGPVRTLLGRDAAQEGQIALRLGREAVQVARHAVMHGGAPVRLGQRSSLIVGDGYQAELGPALIDGGEILHVQPSVQGRHCLVRPAFEKGKVDHVGMEMD
uniref:FHA domain-containing protein n=1 Tax=Parastrongyloides trichosuri TaxID=131310 RepID=A0A0N4ZGX2_PARTI